MNPPVRMRLKSRGIIPHGGYFHIVDPLTGVKVSAVHWDHLVSQVIAERKANGAAVGTELEDEIDSWAAASHPLEAMAVDERFPKRRTLNLDDIVRGTKTILAFKLAGSPLVSDEEAERRSEICLRCPLNLGWAQHCSICEGLSAVVQTAIGAKKTRNGQGLAACNICQCSNKAQIWMPLEILNQALTDEMRQDFQFAKEAWNCWKG
jgi:hypothetical protein